MVRIIRRLPGTIVRWRAFRDHPTFASRHMAPMRQVAAMMRKIGTLLAGMLAAAQVVLALQVIGRLLRTARSERIGRHPVAGPGGQVAMLIPVLNEATRLTPCLEGAIAQGKEVREIVVIDGGSTDRTVEIVRSYTARDGRVRLIESPAPDGVNGKAWQLQAGYEATSPEIPWILTLDADVRPDRLLARSMHSHAATTGNALLSVATTQRLSGLAEGVLHPSMLTTLVYRFGIPGHATRETAQVQANGQCCLVRREALDEVGAFASVTGSVCEDVTLARAVAAAGYAVGFYESDGLVDVEMYSGWGDAWNNWTRSLPMRDRYSSGFTDRGLLEVTLVQALPLWVLAAGYLNGRIAPPLRIVNLILLATRLGVLAGTARAYLRPPWTYWLSPLADLPVSLRLWQMSRRSRHEWRGRTLVTED